MSGADGKSPENLDAFGPAAMGVDGTTGAFGAKVAMLQESGLLSTPSSVSKTTKEADDQRSNQMLAFVQSATAEAYQRTMAFNVGGVEMHFTMEDLRRSANDRYNDTAEALRLAVATGASQEEIDRLREQRDYFDDVRDGVDRVARGDMTEDQLRDQINSHDDLRNSLFDGVEPSTPAEALIAKTEATADDKLDSLYAGLDKPFNGPSGSQFS